MRNEESVTADCGNGSIGRLKGLSENCPKDIECIKDDPHNFVHDGITVRVSFAGMADLNELVKGLFLAG